MKTWAAWFSEWASSFPAFAAGIASVVVSIRQAFKIWESRTVQHWKTNLLLKHRARRLIKLKAREKITLAEIEALEKIRQARVEGRTLIADATADAAKMLTETNLEAEQQTLREAAKPLSK